MIIGFERGPAISDPGSDIYPYPVGLMLPMEDVFGSIAASLGVSVSLPNRTQHQIESLRMQRVQRRWLGGPASDIITWIPRHLELELLLARQIANSRTKDQGSPEELRLPPSTAPLLKLHWIPAHVSENLGGLHISTLESVLLLGGVCPLSTAARQGLRRWLNRHRRWNNSPRRRLFTSILFEMLTGNESGENLLELLLFLWKTVRYNDHASAKGQDKELWLDWLAQLLDSLLNLT